MEVKEAEKIVIAKPVASRPTCSKFRSVTELVAGVISVSSSDACYENAVRTFKPRTVRLKPAGEGALSSQDNCRVHELQCNLDKFLKSDSAKRVIYKPIARAVPKTTVSVLAKLGRYNSIQDQDLDEANLQMPNFVKDKSSFDHENLLSQPNNEKTVDKASSEVDNFGEEQRSVPRTANNDSSYDGYNWRKYGQKHVKGSKFPRSYYKCTHPNCPVKKKVEHALHGQFAEIVYKGEHNHSKPYIINRNSFDGPCQVNPGIGSDPLCNSQHGLMNGVHEGNDDSMIEYRLSAHSSNSRQAAASYDPNTTGASNSGVSNLDHSSGQSCEIVEGYDCMDMVDEERKRKTRKNEHQINETCSSVQETDVVSDQQASIDSEITKDRYRWRKYGQKIVKGNSYPRSYYKCTNQKCNVRKYVERTSDDPNAFITTYEGKHNHEIPMKSTHLSMAKTSSDPVSAIEIMHGTYY